MIVELFGPPGAGKSTLFARLDRKALRKLGVIRSSEALKSLLISSANGLMLKTALRIALCLYPKSAIHIFRMLKHKFLLDLPDSSTKVIKQICELILEHVPEQRGKLWSTLHVMERILMWELLKNHMAGKAHILWDEGMLQGAYHVSASESLEVVLAYTDVVLTPDIMITIEADIAVLVERACKRDKKLRSHKGKSRDEISSDVAWLVSVYQEARAHYLARGIHEIKSDSRTTLSDLEKHLVSENCKQ